MLSQSPKFYHSSSLLPFLQSFIISFATNNTSKFAYQLQKQIGIQILHQHPKSHRTGAQLKLFPIDELKLIATSSIILTFLLVRPNSFDSKPTLTQGGARGRMW